MEAQANTETTPLLLASSRQHQPPMSTTGTTTDFTADPTLSPSLSRPRPPRSVTFHANPVSETIEPPPPPPPRPSTSRPGPSTIHSALRNVHPFHHSSSSSSSASTSSSSLSPAIATGHRAAVLSGAPPMLSALNSKLRRRNSHGGLPSSVSSSPFSYPSSAAGGPLSAAGSASHYGSLPKVGPQRSTKNAQKLKLLPNPELDGDEPDEESGRDVYSQYTRIKDPTARRDAARLGKADRERLPRVTAYCTANKYQLDGLMRFLKGRGKGRGANPKLIDECIYTPYNYNYNHANDAAAAPTGPSGHSSGIAGGGDDSVEGQRHRHHGGHDGHDGHEHYYDEDHHNHNNNSHHQHHHHHHHHHHHNYHHNSNDNYQESLPQGSPDQRDGGVHSDPSYLSLPHPLQPQPQPQSLHSPNQQAPPHHAHAPSENEPTNPVEAYERRHSTGGNAIVAYTSDERFPLLADHHHDPAYPPGILSLDGTSFSSSPPSLPLVGDSRYEPRDDRLSHLGMPVGTVDVDVVHSDQQHPPPQHRESDSSSPFLLDTEVHTPEVFLFDYGVVVVWGMSAAHEQRFLKEIAKFETEKLAQDDVEAEFFNFYYTREYQARIYNDFITLRDKNNYMTKLAISHALAQSVKTSLFEELIASTIDTCKDIPTQIAISGTISLSRTQINMQIGELFILRINIHLNGSVLDTPELFWVEPQLEPVYQAVRSYLEMDQRVGLLTERLDVIADLLAVLKDQLSHGYGEKLEWIVIVLIAAEILVAAINVVVDLYAAD